MTLFWTQNQFHYSLASDVLVLKLKETDAP